MRLLVLSIGTVLCAFGTVYAVACTMSLIEGGSKLPVWVTWAFLFALGIAPLTGGALLLRRLPRGKRKPQP